MTQLGRKNSARRGSPAAGASSQEHDEHVFSDEDTYKQVTLRQTLATHNVEVQHLVGIRLYIAFIGKEGQVCVVWSPGAGRTEMQLVPVDLLTLDVSSVHVSAEPARNQLIRTRINTLLDQVLKMKTMNKRAQDLEEEGTSTNHKLYDTGDTLLTRQKEPAGALDPDMVRRRR